MNFPVVEADFVTFVEDQAFKGEADIGIESLKACNSDSEEFEEIGDIY